MDGIHRRGVWVMRAVRDVAHGWNQERVGEVFVWRGEWRRGRFARGYTHGNTEERIQPIKTRGRGEVGKPSL